MIESSTASGQPTGASRLLSVRDLVVGYGGGDVLHSLSFEVQRNTITCIVGPNGSGKSTLLLTLSGILRPRSGEIMLGATSLVGLSPRQILRAGIVQVAQQHTLFPNMTVRKNVELGAFLLRDKALVRERLLKVGELFPLIEERASARAGTLSGGQQRIVELCRGLMLEPTLVILDEPSLGLDPRAQAVIFETVLALKESGRSVLLVEQNARAALSLSDHGIVLESGVVRLDGSGREVLEHPDIGRLFLGGTLARMGT